MANEAIEYQVPVADNYEHCSSCNLLMASRMYWFCTQCLYVFCQDCCSRRTRLCSCDDSRLQLQQILSGGRVISIDKFNFPGDTAMDFKCAGCSKRYSTGTHWLCLRCKLMKYHLCENCHRAGKRCMCPEDTTDTIHLEFIPGLGRMPVPGDISFLRSIMQETPEIQGVDNAQISAVHHDVQSMLHNRQTREIFRNPLPYCRMVINIGTANSRRRAEFDEAAYPQWRSNLFQPMMFHLTETYDKARNIQKDLRIKGRNFAQHAPSGWRISAEHCELRHVVELLMSMDPFINRILFSIINLKKYQIKLHMLHEARSRYSARCIEQRERAIRLVEQRLFDTLHGLKREKQDYMVEIRSVFWRSEMQLMGTLLVNIQGLRCTQVDQDVQKLVQRLSTMLHHSEKLRLLILDYLRKISEEIEPQELGRNGVLALQNARQSMEPNQHREIVDRIKYTFKWRFQYPLSQLQSRLGSSRE